MFLNQGNIKNINFLEGYLADRIRVNKEVTLKTEYEQLKKTKRLHVMELSWKEGMPNKPHFFWDSDVAKWIEACSYSLMKEKDNDLIKEIDYIVDLMEKAQCEDGYLNSYFSQTEKQYRWKNLKVNHELYCAGHLIEGAIAYYVATNKDNFLNIMCRYVDYINTIFGKEKGKLKGYPGHQEIELALVKLYSITDNKKYLDLAEYFILERGKQPHYYDIEEATSNGYVKTSPYDPKGRKKHINIQAHEEVINQESIEGHAVRALYFLCGVADVAYNTNNDQLKKACKRLYENMVNTKMYITGGIGSNCHGEQFSFGYDLTNERAYAETCASIALVFYANRMFLYEQDGEYMDILEKALYNGVLSGISLDGEKFFYSNPLAVLPNTYKSKSLALTHHMFMRRQEWFGCACCPPNIARLLSSLGNYAYSFYEDDIYLNIYSSCKIAHKGVTITQKTKYPFDENIDITINTTKSKNFTLVLRIPGWCNKYELVVNNKKIVKEVIKGYIYLNREFSDNDKITLVLKMPVVLMTSNPLIRFNINKLALMRGPIVYCLEEIDNDKNLNLIAIDPQEAFTFEYNDNLLGGSSYLLGNAYRQDTKNYINSAYKPYKQANYLPITIKAIPYSMWSNRAEGEMLVWINKKQK